MKRPKFQYGQEVWLLFDGRAHNGYVSSIEVMQDNPRMQTERYGISNRGVAALSVYADVSQLFQTRREAESSKGKKK